MKCLGKIDSAENFENYCTQFSFLMEKDIFYHKNRVILDWINEDFYGGYLRFEEIINKFGGCSKSLLLFYKKGGQLRLHRDSSEYGKVAYSISSKDFEFIFNGDKYNCRKGYVYSFNSKLVHGIERIKDDRWCLVWWS